MIHLENKGPIHANVINNKPAAAAGGPPYDIFLTGYDDGTTRETEQNLHIHNNMIQSFFFFFPLNVVCQSEKGSCSIKQKATLGTYKCDSTHRGFPLLISFNMSPYDLFFSDSYLGVTTAVRIQSTTKTDKKKKEKKLKSRSI